MLNKIIVMGRLTADPELKQTPNGVHVTSFSIATPRNFAAKGVERVTDFLDVVAWRSAADFICRYFSKGQAVIIEGSVQTRSYTDKQGNNRRVWEIIATAAYFAEKKADPAHDEQSHATEPAGNMPVVTDFEEIEDNGDLPF